MKRPNSRSLHFKKPQGCTIPSEVRALLRAWESLKRVETRCIIIIYSNCNYDILPGDCCTVHVSLLWQLVYKCGTSNWLIKLLQVSRFLENTLRLLNVGKLPWGLIMITCTVLCVCVGVKSWSVQEWVRIVPEKLTCIRECDIHVWTGCIPIVMSC